jgi:hypothetical protein
MYKKNSDIWVLLEKACATMHNTVPCSRPHRRQKIPEISPVSRYFPVSNMTLYYRASYFTVYIFTAQEEWDSFFFDNVNINNGDTSG